MTPKLPRIANIYEYWNTRRLDDREALLAIGKILDEKTISKPKPSVANESTEKK
jgi:hypothetical protein